MAPELNKLPNFGMDSDDPYSNIYQYAYDYQFAMREMGQGVGTKYPEHETLAVIVKTSELDQIIANSNYMAAVFGIEKGTLTVSFLGVNVTISGGAVVSATVKDEHVSGGLPGQEVWPKMSISQFTQLLPPSKREKSK